MTLEIAVEKTFKGFKLCVQFNHDNDIMGVLGASGSGKSMTLKCIAGIETPQKGRIVLNGRVLFEMCIRDRYCILMLILLLSIRGWRRR